MLEFKENDLKASMKDANHISVGATDVFSVSQSGAAFV